MIIAAAVTLTMCQLRCSYLMIMIIILLFHTGQQGEGVSSFLAMLASSSSEEIDAELQERLESSCKQARRVAEVYGNLKNTVDQLKKDESGTGETRNA